MPAAVKNVPVANMSREDLEAEVEALRKQVRNLRFNLESTEWSLVLVNDYGIKAW